MTTLKKIQIFEKKGEPGTPLDTVEALEGHGLEGDRHCMKGRPISFCDQRLKDWVAAQEYDGLCFRKYKTNLIFDDIDGLPIEPGGCFKVGEDAVIEVDSAFKECYGDKCELYREGVDCIMPGRMIFACCAKGGTISVGDSALRY